MSEPVHSPLGASAADRWLNCPGSNVILKKISLPQSDEADYQAEGTGAHEAAAHCLQAPCDTWEIVGQKFHGIEVTPEMGGAIQQYLDYCRTLQEIDHGTIMIEERIGGNPQDRPHKDFYGTVDFAVYGPDVLEVVDFKYGAGIVVEPENNSQMMYYAYGIIYPRIARGVKVRSDRMVRLSIVQPRAFHFDGPIRTWETTAGEIIHWAENELIPAMERADFDTTLDPGKWCRFCPAKLFCPMLAGLFGAAAKADPTLLPNFGQKRLALEYTQRDAVKFYVKAMEDEVYRRAMLGNTVPGTKLVLKKANRIFRDSIEIAQGDGTPRVMETLEYLYGMLGDVIYTKPALKSPAEVEKIGPKAKELVKKLAYMPNAGLTIAPEGDTSRPAVKVERAADAFSHLIEQADATATTGDAQ